MRRSRKIKIAIISGVIAVGLLTTKVNASQIEIKPNSKGIRNITVSQSYVTCRNLDSLSSTLGTTALDPHLVTNKDWGAVAYLANSDYGVGANGHTTAKDSGQGLSGKEITLDGVKYFSTSGNATGVMNWGANPNEATYTQTASLVRNLTQSSQITDEVLMSNVKVLLGNIGSKYVESAHAKEDILGKAFSETSYLARANWNSIDASGYQRPVGIRNGLFGYSVGTYYPTGPIHDGTTGRGLSDTTFRPVIWNIN